MLKKLTLIYFLLSIPVLSQIKIVTTLHPFQQIIQKVVGSHGKVVAILKPGFSPHTYEVSPSEVKEIESADILFYGSEDLDGWALKFENRNKFELINLLPKDSLLTIKTIVDNSAGIDPHFWSDPLLVKILVEYLAEILCKIKPDGCTEYESNAKKFSNELDELCKKIISQLSGLRKKNVMMSHPFFAYFLNRFNFEIAALIEPIPGKEPTAKDLKKLIDIAMQKNVSAVFIHSQLPEKPAQIISESTGIKIFTLDPIGGVQGRMTYEELLLYNTEIIKKALK